ncbi:MAG: hypothetical protein ACREAS_08020, partial [Nitrososphaera sp.]
MNKSVALCLVIRYLAVPSIIASSPILPYPHAENITNRVLPALLFETSPSSIKANLFSSDILFATMVCS